MDNYLWFITGFELGVIATMALFASVLCTFWSYNQHQEQDNDE